MKFTWIILAGAAALWLLRTATTQMCQEEIRTRMTGLPYALVRVASKRLPEEAREDVADEWRGELAFVLRDTDGLPLTRLLRGIRFAMGLVWSSRVVARELSGDFESAAPATSPQEILELVEAIPFGYRGPTACAAAGITYRQIDYWARTGLVEPSIRGAHGSGSNRLYSFRDILILKTVRRLLDTGISLNQIRAAVHHLRNRATGDLALVTLMSDGKTVYECTSADEIVDLLEGGQGTFGIALGRVWQEVEGNLAELPAVRADSGWWLTVGPDELSRRNPPAEQPEGDDPK